MKSRYIIPIITASGVLLAGVIWLIVYSANFSPGIGFDGPAAGILGIALAGGGCIAGVGYLLLTVRKLAVLPVMLSLFVISLILACFCCGTAITKYAMNKYPDGGPAAKL